MSVGTVVKGGALPGRSFHALIERWRGGSWHLMGAPVPSDRELVSVSCPRASSCLAVGDAGAAARWNGHSWKRVPAPRLSGGTLLGVGCPSPGDCWASGEEHGGTAREVAVFVHWNGHSWSVHRAPKPSQESIESVSCVSRSDCWAAGSRFISRVRQPWIADHWNGRRWQSARLPSPGRFQGTLSAHCDGPSTCWAVGSDSRRPPVALHLVKGHWHRVPAELPPLISSGPHALIGLKDSATFSGVSCAAPRDCWAVGTVSIGNEADQTLAEHWTGRSWTVVSTGYPVPIVPPHLPVGSGFAQTALSSVSCPSTATCMTVGDTHYDARTGRIVRGSTLAETTTPR